MENIVDPDDTFDFSKLKLGHPNNIQGGAYFTQVEYNSSPLYIQTPKCLSKQGIVKTGKKYFMDLMFGNSDESFIKWIENLEETCKSLLFEKREEWFQNSLDENDIDNAFNSIFKIFKSGRYYLLKSNVKSLSSNEPNVKIYNENEEAMSFQSIDDKSELISIIEIRGIRFTTRNFQLDIELKQIMVLDNEPLFNNCIIKNKQKVTLNDQSKLVEKEDLGNEIDGVDTLSNDNLNETSNIDDSTEILNAETSNELMDNQGLVEQLILEEITEANDHNSSNEANDHNRSNEANEDNDIIENKPINEQIRNKEMEDNPENIKYFIDTDKEQYNLDSNANDLEEAMDNKDRIKENMNGLEEIELDFSFPDELTDNNDLKEININDNHLEENDDLMLKKPNQIFYDLYKEAREKAKKAKKDAVLAFLEAKKIKQTYMVENLNDLEDSDIDDDIDQVSESELNV